MYNFCEAIIVGYVHPLSVGFTIGVMMAKAIVLLALLVVVSGATASSVSSLNFLLMVVNGSELVLSAADQALEEINNDSTVLPHHRLKYTLRYTQVNMLNRRLA